MEQELRNKVKDAAKEYYKEVFGSKRTGGKGISPGNQRHA